MYKILIYDPNARYVTKLVQQLSAQKSRTYIFFGCTDIALHKRPIEGGENYDVLIYSGLTEKELSTLKYIPQHILFSEIAQEENKSTIYKYQSVQLLVQSIDSILGLERAGISGATDMEVEVFLSAEGGVGKTTVALNTAKFYSKSFRTLFLSFEAHSDLEPKVGLSLQHNMTELFYYVKRNEHSGSNALHKVLECDENLGFTLIAPFESVCDLNSIGGEDITRLMGQIAETGLFQKVIIDASNRLDNNAISLLECSSQVWLAVGFRQNSKRRLDLYKRDLAHIQETKLGNRTLAVGIVMSLTCGCTPQVEGYKCALLPYDLQVDHYLSAQVYAATQSDYYKSLERMLEEGGKQIGN